LKQPDATKTSNAKIKKKYHSRSTGMHHAVS